MLKLDFRPVDINQKKKTQKEKKRRKKPLLFFLCLKRKRKILISCKVKSVDSVNLKITYSKSLQNPSNHHLLIL